MKEHTWWRTLDELAEDPAFVEQLYNEFLAWLDASQPGASDPAATTHADATDTSAARA